MVTKPKPATRLAGYYFCHACGKFFERESEDGKTLKKWVKSFCAETGKDSRLWLKLIHNMPKP